MGEPTLSACGELVRRGDSDRFLSAMTAPPEARERLFTLYAFNLEVARIPAVVSEPMLGQIRLQWWRETISLIYEENRARSHEVVGPLAALIEATALPRDAFDRLLDARARDIDGPPPENRETLDAYLRDTGGALLGLAAHALAEAPVDTSEAGFAFAAAAYLEAVPALGSSALPGDPAQTARALAADALAALASARAESYPAAAVPALRAGWSSGHVLRAALRKGYDPMGGPSRRSPLRKNLSLLWRAARGRW
jgi:hypothetical protein